VAVFAGKNCNHVAGRVIEAKGSVVYGFADDGFSRAEVALSLLSLLSLLAMSCHVVHRFF
jgi:hypothetical protein